jgi:hydrogenase-4 component B
VTAALLVGAALVAIGSVLAAFRPLLDASLGTQVAGACTLAAGGVAVLASGREVGSSFHSGVDPAFGIDGLSAFFLVVVAATALPALLFARDALRGARGARALAALSAAFLLSLVGVLGARDVTTFLAFWELMTLVPATAILVSRRDRAVRRAVFVYLAITHLGGAGVWVALLTLAQEGALGGVLVDGPRTLVLIAALVGFGTKAGLMPLHSWLPRAHPVAPSHISALMSGVMIKVALYGLIRVLFEWTAPTPAWIGFALLGVGALSALGGVVYALVQHELKRLLAFHSIENVGIIALGLGAAILLRSRGDLVWADLAFAAALLHTANHAAFKALLFLAAGAFGQAAGSLELDRLGGLLRRMPWTGWTFLIGCAAIAGVPPLNGFVSEWLTLQGLLHVGFSDAAGFAAAGALAAAALAATAALALYCFVKVVGLVLLGRPRSPEVAAATERPPATRSALVILAAACVLLGVLPGLVLPTLAGLGSTGAAAPATHAGLELPGTGGLPTLALLVALAAVVAVLLRWVAAGSRSAPAPAWVCGQPVEPSLDWTSAGFTKPLRLVLESVLRPQREIEIREERALVQEISYHAEVPHLFDTVLYAPPQRAALRAARAIRRLQSGSLRGYILYLLGLVLVLLGVVRLGGIG